MVRPAPPKTATPPTQRVDPQRWIVYFDALIQGASRAEGARQAGIAYTTVARLHERPASSSGLEFYKQWLTDDARSVLGYEGLGREAKKAYNDFEYFRLRYFGHISLPWHRRCAEVIVEKLATPDKEYLVINCPPGCLSGDTMILVNRGGNAKRMAIRDLVTKFNGGTLGRQGEKAWNSEMETRVQRAVTGVFAGRFLRLVPLVRAVESGVKTTFTLTTDSGRTIRATAEHPFMVDGGAMVPLGDLRPGDLVLVDGGKGGGPRAKKPDYRTRQGLLNHPHRGAWPYRQPTHRLVVEADLNSLPLDWFVALLRDADCDTSALKFLPLDTHVHHLDEDPYNNALANLEVLPTREHLRHHGIEGGWANVADRVAGERVVSVVEFGEEETYDLTVLNDPHNFVANGFVVSNSGKSTLLTHDIVLWALMRNRALRVLIGTGAATTGGDYVQRIRNSLDRVLPMEADEHDAAMGLACDAKQTLLHDFGRFKPDGTGYWRADKFVMARAGGAPAHQKEASVVAYGQRSQFLGGRHNLVVWDDVVTDANSRTMTQQAELARWWRSTAESRLEPGGVLVLMGQRMGPHDLYRHALDLRDITDTLDIDVDEIDVEALPRKYHHVKFPAHDETKCKGGDSKHRDHHPSTARPWPKGCLLDPKRLTYRDLRVHQYNDAQNYAVVYQQEDTDPTSVLVNPIWIKGGEDPVSHVVYPGCWDTERHVGQIPDNLSGSLFSVISADPSPTQFWGVTWWLYQQETDFHHLIDIERGRMSAPDFLDWNHATQSFSGLLETWHATSVERGHPVTHVILESNAAQKFLLQYDHAKRWSASRGVDLVSHDTHRNKSDPKYGVTALAPHYRHGKVRLPGHWASRVPVMNLYNEVTHYPHGSTTDLLMSHWFLLWQAPRIFAPKLAQPYAFARPTWMRDSKRGLRSA